MDKRGCRRLPVQIGCWMIELDTLACIQTFDISDEGVSIKSDEPLAVGKMVRLRFFTPQSAAPVEVEAEVVWSREDEADFATGLKFVAAGEVARQIIRDCAAFLKRQRDYSLE